MSEAKNAQRKGAKRKNGAVRLERKIAGRDPIYIEFYHADL